jgi:hypothetical protein
MNDIHDSALGVGLDVVMRQQLSLGKAFREVIENGGDLGERAAIDE